MDYRTAYNHVRSQLLQIPVVMDRLERADTMLRDWLQRPGMSLYSFYQVHDNLTWLVKKESTALLTDTSRCYTVSAESCTCPDADQFVYRVCKHMLAVRILEAAKTQGGSV